MTEVYVPYGTPPKVEYGIKIKGKVQYISANKKDLVKFMAGFSAEEQKSMELVKSKDQGKTWESNEK